MRLTQGWLAIGLLTVGLTAWTGCNQSSSPETETANNADFGDDPAAPPTASINSRLGEDDDDEDDTEAVVIKEPEAGTPEWHIREILRIRLMPYSTTDSTKTSGKTVAATDKDEQSAPPADPEKEFAKQATAQRERNEQVIELAKQAIALSHKDPEKSVVFNAAVHHLLDARLQLALAGEQADVDALYEIAEALQNSKPNTEIASAAALTIVNFSHANAVRYAQTEPKWIQEFARQAQLFATRVSEAQAAVTANEEKSDDQTRAIAVQHDASRAAQILIAAGQSCDAAGFADDAKTCYQLVKAKFPETPQAQQVAGVLRRYNLIGKPLQLAGPTLDGNFLSIEDFKGKTVLVVFWSSEAKPFIDQLPAMTELLKKAQKHVSVIGVCLDTDESQLDAFLEETGLAWPQIFYSEPDKRGWNSPVASYYGINQLPTVWIVDSAGVVAETSLTASDLESKLKDVVRASLKAAKTAGSTGVIPAGNATSEK